MEFEAVNPEQHKKKDELQISSTIWNNRRLDVLIKEFCDNEEELAQFDYILKQLLLVQQEYHPLLEDDEKLADEEWFEVDECVFTFKYRVYNWLKEAETEQSA